MNATTCASHEFCQNWVRPGATPRTQQILSQAGRSLAQDLFWALAPGVLGVAVLALLMALH